MATLAVEVIIDGWVGGGGGADGVGIVTSQTVNSLYNVETKLELYASLIPCIFYLFYSYFFFILKISRPTVLCKKISVFRRLKSGEETNKCMFLFCFFVCLFYLSYFFFQITISCRKYEANSKINLSYAL